MKDWELTVPPCTEFERLIARRADGEALDAASSATLSAHLETCARCREALEDQQLVARVLSGRPADRVSPWFAAAVAARIASERDFLDMVNWKAWTIRLAPVAAALAFVAYLTGAQADVTMGIDEWTAGQASAASDLLPDQGVTSESLLEQMLTGEQIGAGGTSNGG